ncbi:MAG: 3-carboxymuconate cyclase, partial [Chthoniobacter sp.]|nr:3-carboxymuconate cyclase [Chthoniobacter sp.]
MLTVLPPVRLAFLSLCAAAMLPALTSAHAVTTHEIVASFEVPPKLPDGDLVLASDDFLWGTSSEGGAYDLGTVFRISQDGGARETVLSFSGNGARNKGSKPRSSLLSDNAGFLWGVTSGGGEKNSGTIFKVNLMTRALTTVLEFSGSGSSNRGGGPSGGLADDGRGFFWGTTMVGGTWGHGTIFKVSANGGVFTTVVELTGSQTSLRGSQPTARLANDGEGFFWGTTSLGGTNGLGTVFKVHIGTGQMTSVLSFTAEGVSNRGARPNGNLVSDGAGFMWGTTLLGGAGRVGTIFKVNRSTGALTTVLEFTGTTGPYKGAGPSGGLIKDGAGFLWGTTRGGGSTNYGTVFKLDPAAGALTTLYEFPSDGRSLASSQGQPRGGFVSNGAGSLWATSSYGGLNRLGTIFQVHENTGAVTTMAEFSQWKDEPRMPKGEVVSDGAGFFWGTSEEGGADRSGTVFKVDAITGNSIAMAEFTGNGSTTRGASPNAELVSDGLGSFWGTTQAGGAADKGTVFKIDRASGVLTTVVEFGGEGTSTRGARPAAGLISDGAGFFWGTTEEGGNTASGTLFKVEASSGALTTVVDFSGNGPTNKGAAPRARLVLDGNGSLWGTTFGGGAANAGTVFAVNANTGAMMTVVEFTSNGASNRGAGPAAGLTRDGAGLFWGTTSAGGAGNFGTVFKLNASTGALTTVIEFSHNGSTNRGAKPLSSLVGDGLGFFWGTTNAGVTFQRGTVFKVNANTGELTTVVEFTGSGSQERSGNNPGRGSLLLHTDGNLYGTTSAGGPEGAGTLFRLRPDFTPVAPAVETLLAENTRTTAGLHASVSAGGAATTVEFFLNNQLVGTVPAGSGSAPTGIDLSVTGLSPHTVYTVTTRATNSAGTTLGRELAAITFTTWNAEPNAPAQLEETPEDQPVTFTLGA